MPAGLIREQDAAMLERLARRAEREYKRSPRKVGHMLGATWLKSAAQMLRTNASMDRRMLLPMPREATTVVQPGAKKRGGRRP